MGNDNQNEFIGDFLEDHIKHEIVELAPRVFGKDAELPIFQWDEKYGSSSGKKRIIIPSDKKVFSILGGVKGQYVIQVSNPIIIVTGCGIENTYRIKKKGSFNGLIGLISGIGHKNEYYGADIAWRILGENKYYLNQD